MEVSDMEIDFGYDKRIQEKKKKQPFISQTDLVYDLLQEDIILLRYREPGSKVNQDQLANLLGVSRSPVRDAINRLIGKGVLVRRSRNGCSVYILTMKDATHIAEIRTAIEVDAGRLATKRATDVDMEMIRRNIRELADCDATDLDKMINLDIEFHNLLVTCSKNEYIIQAYRECAIPLRQIRNCSMTASAIMRDKMVLRHGNILSAIVNRNSKQIESAIRTHLQNNLEDYVETEKHFYK